MKKTLQIAIIFVILINSSSLGIQYLYINYLCEDKTEFLEIAGKKISVCGKVCSLEEADIPESQEPINTYKTDSPFLFVNLLSEDQLILTAEIIDYFSVYSILYEMQFISRDIKPPTL